MKQGAVHHRILIADEMPIVAESIRQLLNVGSGLLRGLKRPFVRGRLRPNALSGVRRRASVAVIGFGERQVFVGLLGRRRRLLRLVRIDDIGAGFVLRNRHDDLQSVRKCDSRARSRTTRTARRMPATERDLLLWTVRKPFTMTFRKRSRSCPLKIAIRLRTPSIRKA